MEVQKEILTTSLRSLSFLSHLRYAIQGRSQRTVTTLQRQSSWINLLPTDRGTCRLSLGGWNKASWSLILLRGWNKACWSLILLLVGFRAGHLLLTDNQLCVSGNGEGEGCTLLNNTWTTVPHAALRVLHHCSWSTLATLCTLTCKQHLPR